MIFDWFERHGVLMLPELLVTKRRVHTSEVRSRYADVRSEEMSTVNSRAYVII